MADPGKLLREARLRHGVSQKNLAIRAGTTRSAISHVERNRVSPSVETLQELFFLLGEDLILDAKAREMDVDRDAIRKRLRLSPDARIQQALTANGDLSKKPSVNQVVGDG